MKWFLFNILFSLFGYYIVENSLELHYEKPAISISVFSSAFIFFWLMTYFIKRRYFFKIQKVIRFTGFILRELVISNLRITYDILTPGRRMNPAIIAIPLDVQSDFEIVALATLITFTPGTLSLKVSDDKKILYVHEMYIPGNDTEAVKKRIKTKFERRILEIIR